MFNMIKVLSHNFQEPYFMTKGRNLFFSLNSHIRSQIKKSNTNQHSCVHDSFTNIVWLSWHLHVDEYSYCLVRNCGSTSVKRLILFIQKLIWEATKDYNKMRYFTFKSFFFKTSKKIYIYIYIEDQIQQKGKVTAE